ncbi:hypothetical protein D3C84_1094550 [compost metagenome]
MPESVEVLGVRFAVWKALADSDAIEISPVRSAGAWHSSEEGGRDSAPTFDPLIGEPI